VDPELDPPVETTTLDNGLAVSTVSLPHLHTAVCALFVKVGARFEDAKDNGLSHFVEHMLFRGTERYPSSLALNTAVERIGSTLVAETSHHFTLFQLALEPEYVPAAIELLGELVGRPRFDDIELERALVLEEINEDFDEKGVEINADDIARGMAFDDHPLGQRIIGPRGNVERFTKADVKRHFARFYRGANLSLCVAGPVEHGRILELAGRALGSLPAGKRAEFAPAPAVPTGAPRFRHVTDAGSQTNLAVVFRAVPELDERYTALLALLRVLDDGMSTRLHYTLADQKGLAYSVNATIEAMVDAALFEVVSATANTKVPTFMRELFALLDGLRRGEVAEHELAKVRTRFRYEILATIDDAASMASIFGHAPLFHPAPSQSARLAAMSKITVDDVVTIAREVLSPEHLTFVAVGSQSRARLKELRDLVTDWK
jgi:predicted Zn-dependent peptidase